jgi:HK97 family phage major capsid protein
MASAVADQAKVIYFGDWRRFVIRRVNNFTIKRMDERYGEFDQVAWVGFSRSDSKVLNRTAVKYLKCT